MATPHIGLLSEIAPAFPSPPPPKESLDAMRGDWWDADGRRADFHHLWPGLRYHGDLDILAVGHGTWQAANYALRWPEARVVDIDIGTSRLINEIGGLARSFDLIVCAGVLHHLADPDAALRTLRSVLKPDGVIQLTVYAPYGRSGIHKLQQYCRRLGIGTPIGEINNLISAVEALPSSLDQTQPSSSAVQYADRTYSVPQLLEAIDANGLSFVRWYWQAPYLPQCGALAATPHAHRLCKMPSAEQHAAMELWRGTMTSHTVVVCRNDSAQRAPINLDDERSNAYVPIRLPSTQCVQERLPAGAAGVLLNKDHPFHDLILPIRTSEKIMFDAIDGRRTIEEIAALACDGDTSGRGRTFFKKLWCYDQVTFDASAA